MLEPKACLASGRLSYQEIITSALHLSSKLEAVATPWRIPLAARHCLLAVGGKRASFPEDRSTLNQRWACTVGGT